MGAGSRKRRDELGPARLEDGSTASGDSRARTWKDRTMQIARSRWTGFIYAAAVLYLALTVLNADPSPADEDTFSLIRAFLIANVFLVSLVVTISRIRTYRRKAREAAEDEIAYWRNRKQAGRNRRS